MFAQTIFRAERCSQRLELKNKPNFVWAQEQKYAIENAPYCIELAHIENNFSLICATATSLKVSTRITYTCDVVTIIAFLVLRLASICL